MGTTRKVLVCRGKYYPWPSAAEDGLAGRVRIPPNDDDA